MDAQLKSEEKGRFAALIPFFVFVFFYVGLSILAKDFYAIPMPIAFIFASASAFLLDRRRSLAEKMEIFAKNPLLLL